MSQFNSISEDFRESLRALADKIAEEKAGPPPAVTVKVAMEADLEVVEEGTSAPDDK